MSIRDGQAGVQNHNETGDAVCLRFSPFYILKNAPRVAVKINYQDWMKYLNGKI